MDNEEKPGLVDSNFVRAAFYLDPPKKGAPVEEWNAWLEADRKAAIQAKRAYTLTQVHGEVPEFLQPKVLSKVGGVYRQSALVGFVGDSAKDNLAIEAAVDADQDQRTHMTPWAKVGGRGSEGSQRLSGAQRRKAKKASRKARLRIVKH